MEQSRNGIESRGGGATRGAIEKSPHKKNDNNKKGVAAQHTKPGTGSLLLTVVVVA